jgi:H+-translocating NAD(P) transhydrogenase subunit beta
MGIREIIIELSYLIASVLFIIGIKMMGKTATAREGNFYSAVAMLIAIIATLINQNVVSYAEILVAFIIGSAIGTYTAQKVPMTSMPEMVALFNGFGGLASVFVAFSEYWRVVQENHLGGNMVWIIATIASIIIGGVTFTGSYIAFAKLKGIIKGGAVNFPGQHTINLVLFVVIIVASVMSVFDLTSPYLIGLVAVLSLVLGVLVVIPIGGADMPVVVSLLNSYSGIAGCATGFILNNYVLIISGALVGASGIILTQIMCKAMNRSLVSVLLGGFGQGSSSGAVDTSASNIVVKEVGVEESAMIFDSASSVIIVPGYGMAVAQAQHVVKEMADLLEKKNISVKYAIHPVAGRMPGHMNVLLAEANVPYDKLIEMEHINDEFPNCDVVLIIGANDIVNPAARTNPASPIYGMPILNADKAKTVIVSKRSMGAGYAGIDNELFGYPNCLMLFGDAKATMTKVVAELKGM